MRPAAEAHSEGEGVGLEGPTVPTQLELRRQWWGTGMRWQWEAEAG